MDPIDPTMTADYLSMAIEAFKDKNWGIVVAGLIMLALWANQKFFLHKFPKDWLPWVATVSGILIATVTNVFAGMDWLNATLYGVLVGKAASGMWESIGKRTLPKADKKVD